MSQSDSVSSSTKEIYNLPKEVHNTYAQAVDSAYIQGSELIPQQTEIAVLNPSLEKFIELFDLHSKKTFAWFQPPEGYYKQKLRFFKDHILPGIDPEKLIDHFSVKLKDLKLLYQGEKRSLAALWEVLELVSEFEKILKEIKYSMYRYNKG